MTKVICFMAALLPLSRSFCLKVLAILMVGGAVASADTMRFNNPGSVVWDGVYVSPYLANDETNPQHNPLSLYCDDYNYDFSGNPTWNVNINPLSSSDLSQYKYGSLASAYDLALDVHNVNNVVANPVTFSSSFTRYLEAAYLFSKAGAAQQSNDQITQTKYDIAAWSLFVDSSHVGAFVNNVNSSGYGADVHSFLDTAHTQVANGSFTGAGWLVVTPVGNPMQEFMMDPPPVPEPASVLLLGIVLIGCGRSLARRWS